MIGVVKIDGQNQGMNQVTNLGLMRANKNIHNIWGNPIRQRISVGNMYCRSNVERYYGGSKTPMDATNNYAIYLCQSAKIGALTKDMTYLPIYDENGEFDASKIEYVFTPSGSYTGLDASKVGKGSVLTSFTYDMFSNTVKLTLPVSQEIQYDTILVGYHHSLYVAYSQAIHNDQVNPLNENIQQAVFLDPFGTDPYIVYFPYDTTISSFTKLHLLSGESERIDKTLYNFMDYATVKVSPVLEDYTLSVYGYIRHPNDTDLRKYTALTGGCGFSPTTSGEIYGVKQEGSRYDYRWDYGTYSVTVNEYDGITLAQKEILGSNTEETRIVTIGEKIYLGVLKTNYYHYYEMGDKKKQVRFITKHHHVVGFSDGEKLSQIIGSARDWASDDMGALANNTLYPTNGHPRGIISENIDWCGNFIAYKQLPQLVTKATGQEMTIEYDMKVERLGESVASKGLSTSITLSQYVGDFETKSTYVRDVTENATTVVTDVFRAMLNDLQASQHSEMFATTTATNGCLYNIGGMRLSSGGCVNSFTNVYLFKNSSQLTKDSVFMPMYSSNGNYDPQLIVGRVNHNTGQDPLEYGEVVPAIVNVSDSFNKCRVDVEFSEEFEGEFDTICVGGDDIGFCTMKDITTMPTKFGCVGVFLTGEIDDCVVFKSAEYPNHTYSMNLKTGAIIRLMCWLDDVDGGMLTLRRINDTHFVGVSSGKALYHIQANRQAQSATKKGLITSEQVDSVVVLSVDVNRDVAMIAYTTYNTSKKTSYVVQGEVNLTTITFTELTRQNLIQDRKAELQKFENSPDIYVGISDVDQNMLRWRKITKLYAETEDLIDNCEGTYWYTPTNCTFINYEGEKIGFLHSSKNFTNNYPAYVGNGSHYGEVNGIPFGTVETSGNLLMYTQLPQPFKKIKGEKLVISIETELIN